MPGKLILASEKIVTKCTNSLARKCYPENITTGMKIFGVGYGNGRWPKIVPMIGKILILPNTWYYVSRSYKEVVNLNIIREINTMFDDSILLRYKNSDYYCSNIDVIPTNVDPTGIDAIKITVNKSINPIGYYLPEYNSFIFGQIGWHTNYSEIVIPNIWLQILEKLYLYK
jgi:hypothetical protein